MNILKGFFIVILIFFSLINSAIGGNLLKENNTQIEARLHYGFLLSHHLELERFNSHFPMFEFSLQKSTFGKKRWENKYDYPLVGMSFMYSSLGNFDELGKAFALFPYINYPLYRNDFSTINFRMGLGAAWLTNKFHNTDNYKNFAIGSHLNIAASLMFEYKYQLNKRFLLNAGMGLTHFSNGSLKTPNYGLNIFSANIAFTYFIFEPKRKGGVAFRPEVYTFEFDGRKYLEVNSILLLSNKDMSQDIGERFMVYAAYFNIMKKVSYKSKFGLGLDFTSDMSDKYFLEKQEDTDIGLNYIKSGISGVYELCMDKMSFVFNLGIYVGGQMRKHGDAYQRFSLKYLITQNISANLALSTHAGTADYIGLGLGYRFKFIYKRKIKHY